MLIKIMHNDKNKSNMFENMFNRQSGVCRSNTEAANYELTKGKADCKAVQPDQEVVI